MHYQADVIDVDAVDSISGHANRTDSARNGAAPAGKHRQGTYLKETVPKSELAILVAEDDAYLRRLLQMSLQQDGYEPILATNGREALETFQTTRFDLVMLDIQMPEMNGIDACQAIRQQSDVPIIMITALDRPNDIVRSLEVGADDYVTKPFNFKVLQARVQAIMRRISWLHETPEPSILTIGPITVNDETREVSIGQKHVHLTATEYKLLRYLMLRNDETVGQTELLRDIWESEHPRKNSVLEAAIRRLRQKIEDAPSDPKYVITVVGHGYKFQAGTNQTVPLPAMPIIPPQEPIAVEDIQFYENNSNISLRGELVHLSKTEHRLLHYFMGHRDRTVGKGTLVKEVWGQSAEKEGTGAMVTATVQRLRKKIEKDPNQPGYIVTVRGEGYRFCSTGQGW